MSNSILMREGKNRSAPLCLKHYKTRYMPVKRDRIKIPRNAQHPERDQNEIGTRYEFAYFEAIKGQGRVALQYALGFLCWSARCPEKPHKRDTRLKTEIGMNLGNQGPLNGGVSNGGVSRSGLVLPFLSFFVLLGLSRGFSRFVRGLSGDFPDWSFSSFSAF